jgi:hypothetical protein
MDHISEIDQLTRVTRKREFDDGLIDFVFGGTYLMICLANWFFFSPTGLRWIATALLQDRQVTIIGLIALTSFFIVMIFGARKIVDRIRRATIWRDRGFVKSLRWQVSWQTNLAAVGAAISMIVIAGWMMAKGIIDQEAILRVLVSSAGVATGIVFFGIGSELKLQRYKWVGIAGGGLSMLIMVIPTAFHVSWLLAGIIWMAVLSISGLWALRKSISAFEESQHG